MRFMKSIAAGKGVKQLLYIVRTGTVTSGHRGAEIQGREVQCNWLDILFVCFVFCRVVGCQCVGGE